MLTTLSTSPSSVWLTEYLNRLIISSQNSDASLRLIRQLFRGLSSVPWGPLPLFWVTHALSKLTSDPSVASALFLRVHCRSFG